MLQNTIFVKRQAVISTKVKYKSHHRRKYFITFDTNAFIPSC